jgi:hypothetical protein
MFVVNKMMNVCISVPDTDLHVQIMPIVVRVDLATFSWLHAFLSSIATTIVSDKLLELIDDRSR